jgi:hypothetical protein
MFFVLKPKRLEKLRKITIFVAEKYLEIESHEI